MSDFETWVKISKIGQNFDNKYQVSRLYNNKTIHQVEVFSFLYKREMHWVINENAQKASMKDLEKLGFRISISGQSLADFWFSKKHTQITFLIQDFLYF